MRNKKIMCLALALTMLFQPAETSTMTSAASTTDQIETLPEDPGAYRLGQNDYSFSTYDSSSNNTSDGVYDFSKRLTSKKASQSVSPFTNKTYTHADAFDGMNIYNGVDVSYYNTSMDWVKAKAAGIDFAIIRVGYRGYGSTGKLCADSKFEEHITGAIAAGIKVGIYYFTEAISEAEAIEEANYAIAQANKYDVTMPIVIDWEYPPVNTAAADKYAGGRMYDAHQTKEQTTANVKAFCDTVITAGYTPMIYANRSDLLTKMDGMTLGESYPVWYARYNTQASTTSLPYEGKYVMWQYSSDGVIDGSSKGRDDVNFWYTKGTIDNPGFTCTGSSITATKKEPTSLNEPEDVATTTYSKKIKLSWGQVSNAGGYQIYRKDSYNGSFKKIKTITSGTTTRYTSSGLSKNHEYYYKVRAYVKTSAGTIYSDYATLTAATSSKKQAAIAKKALKLRKTPAKKGKKLITVKAGTSMTYSGVTYLKNGKKFLHVQYVTTRKIYDGYLPTTASLKKYTCGTSTAESLNLRKTAGVTGKLLAKIPNGTVLAIMGSKKVKGTTWYKTVYSGKKGKNYTGYVASNYIDK